MKIYIFKGTSFGVPPTITPYTTCKKNHTTWKVVFDDSAKYDFPDDVEVDEDDWSKLLGISWSPIINARKNSVMVGWRYKDDTDKIELNVYTHKRDGTPVYTEPLVTGDPGDVFIINLWVDRKNNTVIFKIFNQTTSDQFSVNITDELNPDIKVTTIGRSINTFFGGNQNAFNTITFEKTII